jgi:hypothetical protein
MIQAKKRQKKRPSIEERIKTLIKTKSRGNLLLSRSAITLVSSIYIKIKP